MLTARMTGLGAFGSDVTRIKNHVDMCIPRVLDFRLTSECSGQFFEILFDTYRGAHNRADDAQVISSAGLVAQNWRNPANGDPDPVAGRLAAVAAINRIAASDPNNAVRVLIEVVRKETDERVLLAAIALLSRLVTLDTIPRLQRDALIVLDDARQGQHNPAVTEAALQAFVTIENRLKPPLEPPPSGPPLPVGKSFSFASTAIIAVSVAIFGTTMYFAATRKRSRFTRPRRR